MPNTARAGHRRPPLASRVKGAVAPRLLAALAVGALSVSPAPGVTLSLPLDAGAPAGSSAVVPLLVDDATGMLGTDILISYDPAVALATGVSKTPLSADQALTINLSTPGTIRISLFGASPLSGGGALLDISFTSAGPTDSETPLDLVSATINEGGIPAAYRDGRYCVQGMTGEVDGVRVDPEAAGSAAALLTWTAVQNAAGYNLYRGEGPASGGLLCLLSGIPGPPARDEAVPVEGGAFFYLVTAVNCRGESGAGLDSEGLPRIIGSACP